MVQAHVQISSKVLLLSILCYSVLTIYSKHIYIYTKPYTPNMKIGHILLQSILQGITMLIKSNRTIPATRHDSIFTMYLHMQSNKFLEAREMVEPAQSLFHA